VYEQDLQRKDESIAEVKKQGAEDLARIKKEAQGRAAELRKRMRGQAEQLAELGEVQPTVRCCQAH